MNAGLKITALLAVGIGAIAWGSFKALVKQEHEKVTRAADVDKFYSLHEFYSKYHTPLVLSETDIKAELTSDKQTIRPIIFEGVTAWLVTMKTGITVVLAESFINYDFVAGKMKRTEFESDAPLSTALTKRKIRASAWE